MFISIHALQGIKRLSILAIVFALLFLLAGCAVNSSQNAETSSQNNETEYHNEPYGFSLTISNDLYENLTINENSMESEGVKFGFIYSEDNSDGTECAGIFFTIEIYNKTTDKVIESTDSRTVLGENDDYYYCFTTQDEPIESMSFDKVYQENKGRILKIADTFKLN